MVYDLAFCPKKKGNLICEFFIFTFFEKFDFSKEVFF